MNNIKVILFDLDDTLIYFDDFWKDSILETFSTHPATSEYKPEELYKLFEAKNEYYEELYNRGETTLKDFRNQRVIDVLADLGKEIDHTVATDFNELNKEICKSYMKANDQLVQMLEELGQHYSLGIVTNGLTSWQLDKIEAMGVKHLFEEGAIIISEEVGHEKPAAEIYQHALNHYKVKPEEVLFIGDSWKNDVEGPNRVGIHSIWLNRKKEELPKYENPNFAGTIHSIYELREKIIKE